jgi:hypothetical protein
MGVLMKTHATLLWLACLAFGGQTRRVQNSAAQLQSSDGAESESSHSLAQLQQSARFSPSVSAARSPAVSARPLRDANVDVSHLAVSGDQTPNERVHPARVASSPKMSQDKESHVQVTEERVSNLSDEFDIMKFIPSVIGFMGLMTFAPEEACAKASDYGLLAGRTGSLVHPITMFALFLTSCFSLYTGWQWRTLRTSGTKLKELQAQAPVLSSGKAKFPLDAKIKELREEIAKGGGDMNPHKADLALLEAAAQLDQEFKDLTGTRNELKTADSKDIHTTSGSILLAVGVTVALLGAFNTYMRADKLFPGPHLFAGMACVIGWALAASLTPYMQKGNDTARNLHIGLNVVNLGLFAWQLVSGFEIVLKVWKFTKWP